MEPIKNNIKNQYLVRFLSPCMYPMEYMKIRNEIHATILAIRMDNESANVPA